MAAYSSPAAVRRHLSRRWLRLHSALIGLLVVAAGYGCARLLWWTGVDNLALRYACVVGFSYAALIMCVRLWIAFVYWRRGDADGVGDALDLAADAGDVLSSAGRGTARSTSWADGVDLPFGALDDGLGIGVVVGLLAAAVLIVAGGGFYLLALAPEVLVEAAIAWVIASGMVRRTAGYSDSGWLTTVLEKTWWMAALCLAIGAGLGAYVEAKHPDANTLKEAVALLLKKQ